MKVSFGKVYVQSSVGANDEDYRVKDKARAIMEKGERYPYHRKDYFISEYDYLVKLGVQNVYKKAYRVESFICNEKIGEQVYIKSQFLDNLESDILELKNNKDL